MKLSVEMTDVVLVVQRAGLMVDHLVVLLDVMSVDLLAGERVAMKVVAWVANLAVHWVAWLVDDWDD